MKRNNAGFALIGSLLAASLATVLFTFVHKAGLNHGAKKGPARPTLTSILAEQKLEHLRGLAWGFDNLGVPVGDTELAPSPEVALQQDTSGYVEYLDDRGVVLGGDAAALPRTRYIRRWSIRPLSSNPENALVIQVTVSSRHKRDLAQGPTRLITVRTRQAFEPRLSQ